MLDHVGIPVGDFGRSKRFYERALSPLGYGPIVAYGDSAAGFGREGKPDFWIARDVDGGAVHVAFASPDRATWTPSTSRPSPREAATTEGRGSDRNTTRPTTALSSSIPTVTTSRRSATARRQTPDQPPRSAGDV